MPALTRSRRSVIRRASRNAQGEHGSVRTPAEVCRVEPVQRTSARVAVPPRHRHGAGLPAATPPDRVQKGTLVHLSLFRPVAALALVVGAALTPAAAAVQPAAAAVHPTSAAQPAAATTSPTKAGAGYLARQLAAADNSSDGILTSGGYPQVGETIDALLSLAAAHVASGQQTTTVAALRPQARSYVSYRGTFYAGSLAKMTLAAQAGGTNPNRFGGVALLNRLRAMECTAVGSPTGCTKADLGLYKSVDPHGTGNAYNSTVYQSLALIALSRTPHRPSAAAARWLVGQQCPDGGFQTAVAASSAQACTSEDNDSTSFAAQALAAVGSRSAAHRAAAYLAYNERSSGAFDSLSGAPSANSTALAAQALIAVGGFADYASSAEGYLVSRQSGCAAAPAMRGAIAAPADGDPTFATSQAVQGVSGTPLARISGAGSSAVVPRLRCSA